MSGAARLADLPLDAIEAPARSAGDARRRGDTVAFVCRFVFDIAVMGIAACDAQYGWMDYAEEESDLRRILYGQTRQVGVN